MLEKSITNFKQKDLMKNCKCGNPKLTGRRQCLVCINSKKKEKKSLLKSLKKPTKKPTDQQIVERLRKQCVQLAKDISKQRDDYKCQYCGIGKPQRMVHSHHFYHEGLHRAMSADVDNLITLCASHHQGGMWMRSNDGFNFHNSPTESTEWFKAKYPERYEELHRRSKLFVKCDLIYWQKKKEELRQLIHKYTS